MSIRDLKNGSAAAEVNFNGKSAGELQRIRYHLSVLTKVASENLERLEKATDSSLYAETEAREKAIEAELAAEARIDTSSTSCIGLN